MPGSRGSSLRTVGRSRDAQRRREERRAGELPGVYELRRKQTITCITSGLISRTHITQRLKITVTVSQQAGSSSGDERDRRGFLQTL